MIPLPGKEKKIGILASLGLNDAKDAVKGHYLDSKGIEASRDFLANNTSLDADEKAATAKMLDNQEAQQGNSMADVASAGIGGAVNLAGGLMQAANAAETGHNRRVAEGQNLGLEAQKQGARDMGDFQNNAFQQLMGAYGSALAKKRR